MQSIKAVYFFFLVLNAYIESVRAFAPASRDCRLGQLPTSISLTSDENYDDIVARRRWLNDISMASLVSIGGLIFQPNSASASGGATAGGVYLLSAKQRYNDRVTAGVQKFLALSSSLDSGTTDGVKAFFSTEDVGGWKDASAAGYLLANAFRRSSSTPPDNLPSVKKWKAFAKEIENLQKSIKKKDVKSIQTAYKKAEELLDPYLELVELPPVIEMRQ